MKKIPGETCDHSQAMNNTSRNQILSISRTDLRAALKGPCNVHATLTCGVATSDRHCTLVNIFAKRKAVDASGMRRSPATDGRRDTLSCIDLDSRRCGPTTELDTVNRLRVQTSPSLGRFQFRVAYRHGIHERYAIDMTAPATGTIIRSTITV
jgi:hypothetical protein